MLSLAVYVFSSCIYQWFQQARYAFLIEANQSAGWSRLVSLDGKHRYCIPFLAQKFFTFTVKWHVAESSISKILLRFFLILYANTIRFKYVIITSSSNVDAVLKSSSTIDKLTWNVIFLGTSAKTGSFVSSLAAIQAVDKRVRWLPAVMPFTRRTPIGECVVEPIVALHSSISYNIRLRNTK